MKRMFALFVLTGVLSVLAVPVLAGVENPPARWAVFVGGALGHGLLGAVLVVGAVLAGVLGLGAGGLGQSARAPLRTFDVVEAIPGEDRATRDRYVQQIVLARALSKRAAKMGVSVSATEMRDEVAGKTVLINMSGRGDKDVNQMMDVLGA